MDQESKQCCFCGKNNEDSLQAMWAHIDCLGGRLHQGVPWLSLKDREELEEPGARQGDADGRCFARYCFMNLRPARDGEGFEPDFPEDNSFGLLADLRNVNWGIYEFTRDTDEEWTPSKPVDDELAALIDSGKRYPPALAIARHDLKRHFDSRRPSQDEFAGAYADSIRSRLAEQTKAPFLMARVLTLTLHQFRIALGKTVSTSPSHGIGRELPVNV